MIRISQSLALVVVATAGLGSIGCVHTDRPSLQDRYAGWADPSWPERYNHAARQSVLTPFATHAQNGAIIDAVVFDFMFEQGSDVLLPGGHNKLDYLIRRRPAPERTIYLQTARDIQYDHKNPEKVMQTRTELDAKRITAIQKYVTYNSAGRPTNFDIQVIDLPDTTQSAIGPAASIRGYPAVYQSGIMGLGGQAGGMVGAGTGGGGAVLQAPGQGAGGAGGAPPR